MKSLYSYLQNNVYEDKLEEGIIRDSISLVLLKNIDSSKLRTGILSMYEYIVNEEDINLFYQDYSLKERPLWKNLYKLYQNKVWSIIDLDNIDSQDISVTPELTKLTPEVRRDLREWIKRSRNNNLNLKPGEIDMFMILTDRDKRYLITINRVSGFFRSIFRTADKKILEQTFNKLNN